MLDMAQQSVGRSSRLSKPENFKPRVKRETPESNGRTERRRPVVGRHPVTRSISSSPPPQCKQNAATEAVAGKAATRPTTPTTPCFKTIRSRKRSPSLPRSRPSSPSNHRRTASPCALEPAVLEAVKKRVRLAQQARLYLLHQPGPNSFFVAGDSPEHKFRVDIGPQTCSCGKAPHCIHLLFVMLRVFQVPEIDSKIYTKELKNFEVEALFQSYHERCNSRINGSHDNRDSGPSSLSSNGSSGFGSCSDTQDSRMQPNSLVCISTGRDESSYGTDNVNKEEDRCPICLLDMVDGESLVVCTTGCHNRLHHHCMAIWATECRLQREAVLCPLCRQQWDSDNYPWGPRDMGSWGPRDRDKDTGPFGPGPRQSPAVRPTTLSLSTPSTPTTPVESNNRHLGTRPSKRTSLPSHLRSGGRNTIAVWVAGMDGCRQLTQLPHAEGMTPEQLAAASEPIKVFGVDLLCCLHSRSWEAREVAFRRLLSDVSFVHHTGNDEHKQRVLSCCAKILATFAADPVHRVYRAWVSCLRTMLAHIKCGGIGDLEEMQKLVRPIIRALVLKCADSNRRTSQLSVGILLEMARGQSGSLPVGAENSSPSDNVSPRNFGLDLNLVLSCVLEENAGESANSTNWQWFAGRLILLEHLLAAFPEEFTAASTLEGVLEFCVVALRNPHKTVASKSRPIFIEVFRLAVDGPHRQTLQRAYHILVRLETTLPTQLRKTLYQLISSSRNEEEVTTPPQRKLSFHGTSTPLVKPSSQPSSITSPHYSPLTRRKSLKPVKLDWQNGLPSPGYSPASSPTSAVPTHRTPPQLHTPPVGPRLYNLFARRSKVDDIPLLPTRPVIPITAGVPSTTTTTTTIGTPSTSVAGQSPQRRLLKDCCPEMEPWHATESSKHPEFKFERAPLISIKAQDPRSAGLLPTPTGHGSGSGSGQGPGPPLGFEPSDTDPDEVVEVVVPLTFDAPETHTNGKECKLSDNNANILNPHKKDLEVSKPIADGYKENVDWIRGPLLGTGAFSACYQARDIATGTIMAVKQVSFGRNVKEEQDRVEDAVRQELTVLSTLRHENVVRILGATRHRAHFNMFVEWMAGGSVAGLLERYGPFTTNVTLRYTLQVLQGLAYLHHKHILHRDLKGANLLVDSSGQHLRIGDLGAAAKLTEQHTLSGEFQGQLLGTIAYMAPEVLRGEDYGRSCDVWSVGCCMIEMATARPPWKECNASNHLALMYKIACSSDPPHVPDTLRGPARQLATACLQVCSDLRPSAADLLRLFGDHCHNPDLCYSCYRYCYE